MVQVTDAGEGDIGGGSIWRWERRDARDPEGERPPRPVCRSGLTRIALAAPPHLWAHVHGLAPGTTVNTHPLC